MMLATPSAGVIERTRGAVRRSVVRGQLQAIAAGKSESLTFDLDSAALDVAALVRQATAGHRPGSVAHQRLAAAFQRSGIADVVVDRLAATDALQRIRSAQLAGALGLAHAVPWITPLLSAQEPAVRDAASRALGRIGGAASAVALLRAIRRDRPTRTLIVELARAAPDLFLETALCSPKRAGTRAAVVIAAGLRGRRAAVSPLLSVLASGNRRERAAACRALGWIKAEIALPTVAASLGDSDWKVRMSAIKALTRLGGDAYVFELEALRSDPDPRVRRTGRIATHRLLNKAARPWKWEWR
jgi:hypothetical protein